MLHYALLLKSVWCLKQKGKRLLVPAGILVLIGTTAVYNYGNILPNFVIGFISVDTLMQPADDPVTSYCSGKADRRGPNQNVISYSLYGNFSDPRHYNRYAGAISYVLSNISQVYPGVNYDFTIQFFIVFTNKIAPCMKQDG